MDITVPMPVPHMGGLSGTSPPLSENPYMEPVMTQRLPPHPKRGRRPRSGP